MSACLRRSAVPACAEIYCTLGREMLEGTWYDLTSKDLPSALYLGDAMCDK
jgi:hypothetical protein